MFFYVPTYFQPCDISFYRFPLLVSQRKKARIKYYVDSLEELTRLLSPTKELKAPQVADAPELSKQTNRGWNHILTEHFFKHIEQSTFIDFHQRLKSNN